MQLNQDNCADEAVDAAFLSKKGKIAWQVFASLFQGRVNTAALVEVHLCKGLWSKELWWIQELSSDIHMTLRLQKVQEVTENLTSKNSHPSLLAFCVMNHHLQDQFILRPCQVGVLAWQVHVNSPELLPRKSVTKFPVILMETEAGTKRCKSLHDLTVSVLWTNQYLGWISFCKLNQGFNYSVLQELSLPYKISEDEEEITQIYLIIICMYSRITTTKIP